MVDPKKAEELIRQHFSSLTTEQFLKNLERSCPEVFEEEKEKIALHPVSVTIQQKQQLENPE
ncbi:MAG: hypothetical protein HC820_04190 [Hydrococcus sp. RM1_1_31]|nr:hypothetical protein [Hydrococcus sp. RM1_1_31]